jgi:O-antigen/teichoic acid export membrane protein
VVSVTSVRRPEEAASFSGVARGGMANLAGALVTAVVNLLIVVVVARGLSRPLAGAFFAATSLFILVEASARLGTDASIVHFLARARALGRPQTVGGYLRTGLVPVLVVGAVAALALAVATPAVLRLVAGKHTTVPHGTALVVTLALTIPLAAGYDLVMAATRGLGSQRPTVLVERLLRTVLQALLVLAAVLAGGGAYAVVVAWLAPYVVAAAAGAWWLAAILRRQGVDWRVPIDRAERHGFWRFTTPRAFTGVVQIALQRFDILLVGAMLGPASAAVYAAATRFVIIGQLGNQAISNVVQPRLGMLVANDDLDAARRLYRVSTAWVVALAWPVYLVVAIAAPLILTVVGHGYRSGASTMVVLAAAWLVASACGLVDFVLITVGKTTWNLGNTVLALVVNVGVDVALIPHIGILGAAVGWAVAVVTANLVPLAQVYRHLGFQPVSAAGVTVALLALGCFGLLPGVVALVLGPRSPIVAVAVAVGGCFYLVQLWRRRRELHLEVLGRSRAPAHLRRPTRRVGRVT